ncbi:outer membrane beta-barrel protein [Psychroflexus maritimus]|uniref:Porin family protein n=1 Tax=Psychroflexus maritimus TaxID=2714865 RepID=A0A967ADX7_9FLAO|nr:outer membrane beta-barrel protein [Psychroflexus maritimus]NGZ89950.1 porin family protein [Psychroflexus maritimus]
MKKTLLFLLLLSTAYFSQAQTEQGKFVIDAKSNFGFINNSPNQNIKNEFNINLQGGYALLDNLFIGPSLDYESLNISNDELRISGFLYGAFAQYFFNFKEDQKVLPYISINYFFGENRIDNLIIASPDSSGISISDSFSVNKLSLNAGISIFLIPKKLTLDLNLNYTKRDFLLTDDFIVTDFGSDPDDIKIYQFNLGFSLFL